MRTFEEATRDMDYSQELALAIALMMAGFAALVVVAVA